MSPIMMGIDPADVDQGDVSEYAEALEAMSDDLAKFGSVVLVFHGYDDDPRGVWEIPEVRRWFTRLDDEVPWLLHLLDPEYGMAKLYFAMLLPSLDREVLFPALEQAFEAMNEHMAAAGLDPERPEFAALTDRIVRSLAN
jgi:hypothetical protein